MAWTTDKLAEKSGYTRRHINRLLNAGAIVGEKIGRDWVIMDEDAERWLEEKGFLQKGDQEESLN